MPAWAWRDVRPFPFLFCLGSGKVLPPMESRPLWPGTFGAASSRAPHRVADPARMHEPEISALLRTCVREFDKVPSRFTKPRTSPCYTEGCKGLAPPRKAKSQQITTKPRIDEHKRPSTGTPLQIKHTMSTAAVNDVCRVRARCIGLACRVAALVGALIFPPDFNFAVDFSSCAHGVLDL